MQRFSLACVEMVPWETIEAGWIALAARTPEVLDAFRRTHRGDWVNE